MLERVTLVGALARLEPLTVGHVPALVAASAGHPEAYRYNVVPQGDDAMAAYVDDALTAGEAGDTLAFATVRRADDQVVGSTRFTRAERWPWPTASALHRADGTPDVVEIGNTWLAVAAQRTGVNIDAKRLMLGHAFEVWGVHRVSFITDARNEQSRRAIEALGARFEGVVRAHRIAADTSVRDSARFSIVAAEWPDVRRRLERRLASHR
jgi:RimJ/RimL family protein N-acetyltransferase